MFNNHIKIRSDLQSCQYLPAKRINVKLPDPLEHLIVLSSKHKRATKKRNKH